MSSRMCGVNHRSTLCDQNIHAKVPKAGRRQRRQMPSAWKSPEPIRTRRAHSCATRSGHSSVATACGLVDHPGALFTNLHADNEIVHNRVVRHLRGKQRRTNRIDRAVGAET